MTSETRLIVKPHRTLNQRTNAAGIFAVVVSLLALYATGAGLTAWLCWPVLAWLIGIVSWIFLELNLETDAWKADQELQKRNRLRERLGFDEVPPDKNT